MRRVLVGLSLASVALAGCGGTSGAGDRKPTATPPTPTTVRYECIARNGDEPTLGTATRASDGSWSIQRDALPDEPPSFKPSPTKVGKDLEGDLRAYGCHVITKSDPTAGSSTGCPPEGTQQPVTMPSLVGMEFAKGQGLLNVRLCAAGNRVAVQARNRHACKAQPGTYVGQSPRPGSVLGSKSAVHVYVEAGPPCKK